MRREQANRHGVACSYERGRRQFFWVHRLFSRLYTTIYGLTSCHSHTPAYLQPTDARTMLLAIVIKPGYNPGSISRGGACWQRSVVCHFMWGHPPGDVPRVSFLRSRTLQGRYLCAVCADYARLCLGSSLPRVEDALQYRAKTSPTCPFATTCPAVAVPVPSTIWFRRVLPSCSRGAEVGSLSTETTSTSTSTPTQTSLSHRLSSSRYSVASGHRINTSRSADRLCIGSDNSNAN